MNKRTITSSLVVVWMLLAGVLVHAQTGTFAVDMRYANLGPGDQVVVRGSIPELGNWTEENGLLLALQSDFQVFSGQIDLREAPSAPVLYKYVILRADGTEKWEDRGNRVYKAAGRAGRLPEWFNDRQTPGTSQIVAPVRFTVDVTGYGGMNTEIEEVALMGGRAPLTFELEQGRRAFTQVADQVWEVTIGFPKGTQRDLPFKLAFRIDGEWQWEWRAGHTNHVIWLDDTAEPQQVVLRYDPAEAAFLPGAGFEGSIDQYGQILDRIGEGSAATRYGYAWAMQALEAGNFEEARTRYEVHKTGHAGGEEIDDFEYRYAHKLYRRNGIAAAIAHIDQVSQEETIAERKAYLEYLKGELNLHAGNPKQARRHFRKAQRQPGGWELVSTYSRQGLLESYLQASSEDSVRKGIRMLERNVQQQAATPQEKRRMLARLERAYAQADMPKRQRRVLSQLATTGSQRQQLKGKLRLAQHLLQQDQPTEALGMLDALPALENLPDQYQRQQHRLRLTAYYNLEQYGDYVTLFEVYRQQFPEDAYIKRLTKWNTYALEQGGTQKARQDVIAPPVYALPDTARTGNQHPF